MTHLFLPLMLVFGIASQAGLAFSLVREIRAGNACLAVFIAAANVVLWVLGIFWGGRIAEARRGRWVPLGHDAVFHGIGGLFLWGLHFGFLCQLFESWRSGKIVFATVFASLLFLIDLFFVGVIARRLAGLRSR